MQPVVEEDEVEVGDGRSLLDQSVDLRIDAADEATPVVRVDLAFQHRQELPAVTARDRVPVEEQLRALRVDDRGRIHHPALAGDAAPRLGGHLFLG